VSQRCLLLAGSWGPERMPARPDRDDADWYLPLHIRDAAAARERIAAQVAAGADVVVAPTWLTHRRALLPLGETRRAAAWTAAAVRLAREAVEIGSERREELLTEAGVDDVRRGRPRPLVAAALPALDDHLDAAAGRLLPPDAASERDYRDQAGLLADAEPDLLLVEGAPTEADSRIAAAEAAATGLPAWLALPHAAVATSPPDAWLDWGHHIGLARLLLPDLASAIAAADTAAPWGGLPRDAGDVSAWLDVGAGALARLDGASPTTLAPIRTAIDEVERVAIERERAAARHWQGIVQRAAAMAPGGPALWLGPAADAPLPAGFDWLLADTEELPRMPRGHFRLLIMAAATEADLAPLLEHGGILVAPLTGPSEHIRNVRCVVADDDAQPPLAIYRREA
jgi:hypothetical protein